MTDRHRTRERWDPRRSKRQREVICLWVEILQLTNEPFLFLLLQVIMLRAQENCRESIDVFRLLYLVLKAGRGEPSPTTNLFTSFLLQSLESAVTGTERTPSTRSSDFNTSCFTKTSRDTDAVGISAPGSYKYPDVCLKDRDGALYLGASRFPSTQWYLVFSGLTARLMVWRYFSLGIGSYCGLKRSLKILSRLKRWFMRFADCTGQGRAVHQHNCAAYVKDSNQPVNIVKKDRMMSLFISDELGLKNK